MIVIQKWMCFIIRIILCFWFLLFDENNKSFLLCDTIVWSPITLPPTIVRHKRQGEIGWKMVPEFACWTRDYGRQIKTDTQMNSLFMITTDQPLLASIHVLFNAFFALHAAVGGEREWWHNGLKKHTIIIT